MPGTASDVEVIAHRGASGYAPEHTFAAYDLALAQGADVLELDVRATSDGDLVVLHDATLARTAGDPRGVAHTSARDVAALAPVGRPLRLESVLARYGAATRYLIELKDPLPAWEGRVPTIVAGHGLAGAVTVQSFDRRALRRLRRRAPWLEVAPLFGAGQPLARQLESAASYAAAVGVWHGSVDAALVLRAHARGLAVRAWTANSADEIERLLALGVDGVITDVPDVARSLAEAGRGAALAVA